MSAKSKPSRARKNSGVPTKIMTYGAFPASSKDARILLEQVFQAHGYKNTLTNIENRRRTAFRALRRELSSDLNALESEVDRLEQEIQLKVKKRKPRGQRDSVEQKELDAEISALQNQKRDLYPKVKQARDEVNKRYFEELDAAFSKEKVDRIQSAAERANVKTLGPNSTLRKTTVLGLIEDFKQRGSIQWVKKLTLDQEAHDALIKARSETSCNSGTYIKAEEAIQRAAKDSIWNLHIKRFESRGIVAIQITKNKGMPVATALAGTDDRLAVTLRPDLHIRGKNRSERQAAEIRFKLSGSGENAVFVTLKVVFHRPLPEDGIIKWLQVKVDRVGYDLKYECQFVLESNTFGPKPNPKNGKHLALSLGWRGESGGALKFATVWNGNQKTETLSFRPTMLNRSEHYADLLGYADQHFDMVRDEVAKWIGGQTSEHLLKILNPAMPRHLREKLDTLPKIGAAIVRWRSHSNLRRVAKALKEAYFSKDLEQNKVQVLWSKWKKHCKDTQQDLFCEPSAIANQQAFKQITTWLRQNGVTNQAELMTLYLEWWVRKDGHLINWARNVEQNLRNYRKNYYRVLAAEWAANYETVTLERWELARLAETKGKDLNEQEKRANHNRQRIGISVLLQAIKEAFGSDRIHEVNTTIVPKTHYTCGGKPLEDLSKPGLLLCSKCHMHYDRNANAAFHLWTLREQGKLRKSA